MATIRLSEKYCDFMRHSGSRLEVLEGTTLSGKTTVGIMKFIMLVAESDKTQHVLAGNDLGTIESNIINADNGLLDVFDGDAVYFANGSGNITRPHIALNCSGVRKTIYVVGYDTEARWKKILGSQSGCIYIDEINIANIRFVRQAMMRSDYVMATLNPDDPSLAVYTEYINRCRPIEKYQDDGPAELLRMLDGEPMDGYTWWYFSFEHNDGVAESEKEHKRTSQVPGTKEHKNLILGLRGRATGLVFSNFDRNKHVVSAEEAAAHVGSDVDPFVVFTAGLDTSYSQKSADTIALAFVGITASGIKYTLDEKTYNNRDMDVPLAPSDTVTRFIEFLERNRQTWGFARHVYIDSADQATITEFAKYKRNSACIYDFIPSYKKTKNVDRIIMERGWLQAGHAFVVKTCKDAIAERESYSWREDKDNEPEDGNDHMIQADQYAWLPYKSKIGDNSVDNREDTGHG